MQVHANHHDLAATCIIPKRAETRIFGMNKLDFFSLSRVHLGVVSFVLSACLHAS